MPATLLAPGLAIEPDPYMPSVDADGTRVIYALTREGDDVPQRLACSPENYKIISSEGVHGRIPDECKRWTVVYVPMLAPR